MVWCTAAVSGLLWATSPLSPPAELLKQTERLHEQIMIHRSLLVHLNPQLQHNLQIDQTASVLGLAWVLLLRRSKRVVIGLAKRIPPKTIDPSGSSLCWEYPALLLL